MANIKISELEELTTVADDDVLPIVDVSEGETRKVKQSKINEDYFNGNKAMGSIIVEDIKCKQLFDKYNANILEGIIDTSTGKLAKSSNRETIYISCEPNETYTISKIVSSRFIVAYSSENPSFNMELLNIKLDNEATSITYTTGANAKYLYVYFYNASYDSSITANDILDSIQIEKGSTATEFTEFKKYGYNSQESMGNIVVDDISCKNYINNYDCWLGTGSGLTVSVNDEGQLILNGTTTNYVDIYCARKESYNFDALIKINKKLGTYCLSNNLGFTNYIYTTSGYKTNTATITKDNLISAVFVRVPANKTFNNTVLEVQLEKGSVATNYAKQKEFSNKKIYSINEQVIGIWENGKTLYKKIFTRKNVSGSFSVDVSSLNIEDVIQYIATIKIGEQIEHTYYNSADDFFRALFLTKTNFFVNIGSSISSADIEVTIEYTKTDTSTTSTTSLEDEES